MTTQRQMVWLVERGQAISHVPTVWWSGDESIGWGGWTDDALKAQRFERKEHAEALVADRSMGYSSDERWADVVEHVFVGDAE